MRSNRQFAGGDVQGDCSSTKEGWQGCHCLLCLLWIQPWDLGMLSESDANPGLSPSSGVIVPFLHRPGVAPELQQEQRPPRCGVGDSRSCSAGDHQHPCLSCLLDSSGAVAGQGSHSLPDSTGEVQEYRFLSRIDVWQKPSQYCKVIILHVK